MPNTCASCGSIHADDAPYLLEGCPQCGSKFFFFVREDLIKQVEAEREKLSSEEIKEIEQDIREIVSEKIAVEKKGRMPSVISDETVVLDLEAIRVIKPGKYTIDVTKLFQQKPIVIRVGPGKYRLDLSVLLGARFKNM